MPSPFHVTTPNSSQWINQLKFHASTPHLSCCVRPNVFQLLCTVETDSAIQQYKSINRQVPTSRLLIGYSTYRSNNYLASITPWFRPSNHKMNLTSLKNVCVWSTLYSGSVCTSGGTVRIQHGLRVLRTVLSKASPFSLLSVRNVQSEYRTPYILKLILHIYRVQSTVVARISGRVLIAHRKSAQSPPTPPGLLYAIAWLIKRHSCNGCICNSICLRSQV